MILKGNSSLCARADDYTRLICDLAIARDKVCVQVGIENMCQPKTKLGRGMQVPVHVAKRVDQYPFFRIVRSDQIRRVAESSIYKGLDKVGSVHMWGPCDYIGYYIYAAMTRSRPACFAR